MNIDDYTIKISQSVHLKEVYGKGLGAELSGRWNKHWADFTKAKFKASPYEIFNFVEGLLKRFALAHLPYAPFK